MRALRTSGDNRNDAKRECAIFDELGSVPTSMSACRVLQVCVALNHQIENLQSYCQRAYVQADLDGPPTFIELPKEWWPKYWDGFKRTVCRLREALYGHPRAGDLWADRLGSVVNAQGFELVDNRSPKRDLSSLMLTLTTW